MDERRRTRELLAINRAIAGAADQQEILRLVVDRTAAFTGASACLLLLAQGDGLARVVRSTGLDPARVAGLAIPLNERIVEELGRQLDIPATDTFTGVPVVGREGLVGVLAVYVVAGRPDHRVVDTELLSALADQAAIALEGAERTRAIRESEQRLASMAAYVPGMLYTYVLLPDGTSRFLYVGPRCRDILEVDERSMMADSSHFWNRIHPGDVERMRQEDLAANREGREFSSEFRVVTPSGGVKWVSVVSRPAPARPGEPAVWNGFILDISDRKLAADRLASAEEKYRSIVTAMAEGVVLHGADGRIIDCNLAAERILGLTRSQLEGRTSIDPRGQSVHEDGSPFPGEEHPAMVALRTCQPASSVTMGVRKPDGGLSWIAINAEPLRHADGNAPHAVVTTFADITIRKRIEGELKEKEARLRAFFQSPAAGIGITAAGTGWVELNDHFCAMLGYTREELLRMDWRKLTHPDDVATDVAEVNRLLADESESFSRDKRYVRKDGTVLWVLQSSSAVRRPDRSVEYVVVIVSDISARTAAEEALCQSEDRFRALADESPVGIFEADARGNNTYLNRQGAQLLGIPLDRARGRGWNESIHPEDRERVFREWDQAVRNGQVFSSELRFLRPGGDSVRIRGYADAVRDSLGQVTGFVGVMMDVTELRSLGQRLAEASRLAAMGTMVAGIAHEINNPLTVVLGNHAVALEQVEGLARVLRRGRVLDREEALRVLDEIVEELRESQAGGARIKQIIRELSTIGKPDAPRVRTRLAEVVAGAMRWLPVELRDGSRIVVEDRGAPDILAAGGQVEQVLVNLITNAVRSMPAGCAEPVTVRIGPGEHGLARLEVIDRGAGIAPAVQARIFEPFFTTRDVGHGMGLGLSVCHSIVTAYGGTISVDTAAGNGSTFRVELPAADPGT